MTSTNVTTIISGEFNSLGKAELEMVRADTCPDCGSKDLTAGPRGGVGQNLSCSACGAWFNIVFPRYAIWGERIRHGRRPD